MPKITIINCDICEKEVSPANSFSNFIGVTVKMDEKAQLRKMSFEGYYCGDCTTEIMKTIDNVKQQQNAAHPDTI